MNPRPGPRAGGRETRAGRAAPGPLFLALNGLAALLVALLVNLITDIRLFSDFGSLTVLGASDVDGW